MNIDISTIDADTSTKSPLNNLERKQRPVSGLLRYCFKRGEASEDRQVWNNRNYYLAVFQSIEGSKKMTDQEEISRFEECEYPVKWTASESIDKRGIPSHFPSTAVVQVSSDVTCFRFAKLLLQSKAVKIKLNTCRETRSAEANKMLCQPETWNLQTHELEKAKANTSRNFAAPPRLFKRLSSQESSLLP